MAKVAYCSEKFTPSEWLIAKHIRFNKAENARIQAERLLAESSRLREDASKVSQETFEDVNKKLEQRIVDVDYWRSEVSKRQGDIKEEINNLLLYKGRLERTLTASKQPLDIAHQCLTFREQRHGIDKVHDEVQENLLKEIDVINGAVCLLNGAAEQLSEQLRLDKKAKYNLENNFKDKSVALDLDNFSKNLRSYSCELKSSCGSSVAPFLPPSDGTETVYKPGLQDSAICVKKNITPQQWKLNTDALVSQTECELNHSIQLRTLLDNVFAQIANDLREQINSTNLALKKRIEDTQATKGKLEDEHAELDHQISNMEVNIDELKKTMNEMEASLNLAKARLNIRSSRPVSESCLDPAHLRIVGEIKQLEKCISALQDKIRESDRSLRNLIRNKLEVEEDIKIKNHTLYIDEVQVTSLRQRISIQQY